MCIEDLSMATIKRGGMGLAGSKDLYEKHRQTLVKKKALFLRFRIKSDIMQNMKKW